MNRWLIALATGVAAVAVSGCGGLSSSNLTESRLRVLHAAPNSGNVDFMVDGAPVLSNAAYATSSGYLQVDNGNRTISVRQTGTTNTIVSDTELLEQNQRYTFVVAGSPGNIQSFTINNNSATPPTGQGSMRIVNAANALGNVDVYITAPGADLSLSIPVASNVAFGGSTTIQNLPAGNWQVRATTVGTTNVQASSGTIAVVNGEVRTGFIIEDSSGGAPNDLVILNE